MIHSHHAEYTRKVNLQKTKVNTTKFVQMEINFVLGKARGHICPAVKLGSMLIAVVRHFCRQAGKILVVYNV